MSYTEKHPCQGCDTGWGCATAGGKVESCEDTCEKLREWIAAHPKPIKDWTLEECVDHCARWIEAGKDCRTCVIHSTLNHNTCIFADCPRHLDLDRMEREKLPRFTEEEVAMAKMLQKVGVGVLIREDDGALHWEYENINYATEKCWLPSRLFPSIQSNSSVKISDIIGEEAP